MGLQQQISALTALTLCVTEIPLFLHMLCKFAGAVPRETPVQPCLGSPVVLGGLGLEFLRPFFPVFLQEYVDINPRRGRCSDFPTNQLQRAPCSACRCQQCQHILSSSSVIQQPRSPAGSDLTIQSPAWFYRDNLFLLTLLICWMCPPPYFFFPHPIFLGQPLFLLAALSPGCSQCSELHLHWTYPSQLSSPTLRSAGTQFPPISPISHLLKGALFAAVSAPGPCEFKASDPFKQRIRATSVFSSRSEVVLILCLESLSNISESCTNGLELHS